MLLRLIPQTTTLKGAIFRDSAMAFAAQRATAESSEANLACPRCESTNTKFCYYNNYNLSQPRHFCKDCRRYWTKGGSLRNVPVGGGTRKSKRPPSSSSSKRPSPASSDPQKPDLFDRQMLDVSGSFSSLLSSTPQFGCLFECCAPLDSCPLLRPPPRPTFDDATAPPSVPENFFGLAADWPDLSIYTPGAGFQ